MNIYIYKDRETWTSRKSSMLMENSKKRGGTLSSTTDIMCYFFIGSWSRYAIQGFVTILHRSWVFWLSHVLFVVRNSLSMFACVPFPSSKGTDNTPPHHTHSHYHTGGGVLSWCCRSFGEHQHMHIEINLRIETDLHECISRCMYCWYSHILRQHCDNASKCFGDVTNSRDMRPHVGDHFSRLRR